MPWLIISPCADRVVHLIQGVQYSRNCHKDKLLTVYIYLWYSREWRHLPARTGCPPPRTSRHCNMPRISNFYQGDSHSSILPRLFVILPQRKLVKGIVQRILRGVNTKKIRPRKLEARPFFFLNFKGTPSQEGHKTIFSGLRWLCLVKVTLRRSF
jgi:hypothetical protein